MENNQKLIDQLKYLNAKREWCVNVANDAAEHKFFDIAKYLRNEANLAKQKIDGVEFAIKSFE